MSRSRMSRLRTALVIALSATFIGLNLKFLPQFILGYLGMPRRLSVYPLRVNVLNLLSDTGDIITGAGCVLSLLCLAFLLFPSASRAQTKDLHVAAASDLQPVLPALAQQYERGTGIKVIASFGSSATLTQQLTNGDPQDVFLSADTAHPQQLVSAGLADDPAPIPYATGVLVLWARKDSPAQPLSLDSLAKPQVQKIAMANDQHAPYGLAARQALRGLNLESKLAPKLAIAENIMQTAQFAESGNAQAAFISLTIASSPHFRELGTFVALPAVYQPIRQSAVVLKASSNKAAAHDFVHWLTSKATQASLKSFGLDPAH